MVRGYGLARCRLIELIDNDRYVDSNTVVLQRDHTDTRASWCRLLSVILIARPGYLIDGANEDPSGFFSSGSHFLNVRSKRLHFIMTKSETLH